MEFYPSNNDPGEIPSVEESGFPGFDRAGILVELEKALNDKPYTALPTLADNMNTMVFCEAVLRSAREGRVVDMSELK